MTVTKHGYAPKSGYFDSMLNKFDDLNSEKLPKWELIELDPLFDSSDISVPEWTKIGETIKENYNLFDGFVVLHGTDTMAYTTSALSFMLEGLEKPVVFTGSQIPLSEIRSDGKDNLVTALLIACSNFLSEVCLYFGGRLIRGNRATKISADGLRAFDSPNFPALAQAGTRISFNKDLLLPKGVGLKFVPFADNIPIAVLKVFPGIQFDLFEGILTKRLKGIVLETFGTGNIPGYDNKFIPMIDKAIKNGTVVTVCTQCLQGTVIMGTYKAGAALKSAGAVCGYDMTVEAAVAKLYYLFSKGYGIERIKQLMETNIRGEITVPQIHNF